VDLVRLQGSDVEPWLPPLALSLLVMVVVVWAAVSARVAAVRAADRVAEAQAEAMRWVSARLGELDRGLVEAQGSAGEAVRRTLTEQLQTMSSGLNSQLSSSQQSLGDGLARATEVFGQLQGRLGAVAEMAARMERLAAEVDELGKILRVPKLRGLMGEHTLEAMLHQVLPDRFWTAQYRFPDGRVVDAVIRLGERLLPVDAKFPLEAYRRLAEADDEARPGARRELVRAVKARVDEIAQRYVRPGEGTVSFALMFIPAEGVYWEVVAASGEGAQGLLEYAVQHRVLPVSPATLYAYVSVVAAGLRGLEVEERAQEIVSGMTAAEHELARFREEFAVVGRHLHNASQRFGEAEGRLDRLERRLEGVTRMGEVGQDSEG